jgi:membrane protein implicated in regulation of membrane protease activity
MLALVAAEGIFEDPMGSTGKGTLHGAVFAVSAFILTVYGRQLLEVASQKQKRHELKSRSRRLVTI